GAPRGQPGGRAGRRPCGWPGAVAWGDAVERVVDERVEERGGQRLVRDEEPVVHRAPELVGEHADVDVVADLPALARAGQALVRELAAPGRGQARSEEHTSELQSREN